MTIEFRPPRLDEEPQLRVLFTEAFGDEAFTDLFFRTGYGPERCLTAVAETVLGALYWFDCRLGEQKCAYLYGIAAFSHCRGRGIGSALIRFALESLQQAGYDAILLVPAEPSLFGYYERLGFRPVSTISECRIKGGTPLPCRRLTAVEYAALRLRNLPENGLVQEGTCLDLLAGYAAFYTTPNAVAAVSDGMVLEFLGDSAEAPGLIAALGLSEATIRRPGDGHPFAMGIGIDGPIHLGLAFD